MDVKKLSAGAAALVVAGSAVYYANQPSPKVSDEDQVIKEKFIALCEKEGKTKDECGKIADKNLEGIKQVHGRK